MNLLYPRHSNGHMDCSNRLFLVCPMRPNDIVGRGTKRHLDERCVRH